MLEKARNRDGTAGHARAEARPRSRRIATRDPVFPQRGGLVGVTWGPPTLKLSRRCEAVKRPACLDLPEDARDEVLEGACVLEAAERHRVVARVANELLR